MRLVRLVVAGIAIGAVAGFAAALLRPRSAHGSPGVVTAESAPLPEREVAPVPAASGEVPR
jgi:hypothetical protein